MRIGMVNFGSIEFDVSTPTKAPLGGSESALCYLALALSERGHQVVIYRHTREEVFVSGIRHCHVNELVRGGLDVLIMQNTPSFGREWCARLRPETKIIMWSQHASNQPAVNMFGEAELQEMFDKYVLISDYQIADYVNNFGIDLDKVALMRNAVAPVFEKIERKKKPWSMCYTSMPFRGLALLPEIFKRVKKVRGEATLTVFSSMAAYQMNDANYETIYKQLRDVEGISYVGGLSQTELAERMGEVAIWTYPNTFIETSCTAAMEAMAAGCQIVTSDLGALPETTAGFGRLVSIVGRTKEEYITDFVNAVLMSVDESQIVKQVDFVRKNYVWEKQAVEWEKLLLLLVGNGVSDESYSQGKP